MSTPASLEFTLSREGEWWVATHIETDVASHGSDPNEAVAMATEALELTREGPESVSDEEHREFLRDLGIEPTRPTKPRRPAAVANRCSAFRRAPGGPTNGGRLRVLW